MEKRWVELVAVGHLALKHERDRLMQRALKTRVPQNISQRFEQALLFANATHSFQLDTRPSLFALLDTVAGNPQIARKTADHFFGLKYANPYDAQYALVYVALMSTLKSHTQIEQAVNEAGAIYKNRHKNILIVDNWYELLSQVREVMKDKTIPWYKVKEVIKQKRGMISPDEAKQCSFLAGSPSYAEDIFKQATPLGEMKKLENESYTNVSYLVGSMKDLVDSNVLASNASKSCLRATQIENDVENAYKRESN